MEIPALPTRPQPVPSTSGHMPARASPAALGTPHPTPASAVPSTLHGTQAPHPPIPSATAAPPTPGDATAAGHSAAVAPGEASAAAAPAVAGAATGSCAAVATATPATALPPAPNFPVPPGASAAAHCGRRPLRRRRRYDTASDAFPAHPLPRYPSRVPPAAASCSGRVHDTPACALSACRCSLGAWSFCRCQRLLEAGQERPYRYGRVPLCPPAEKRTAGLAPQCLRFSTSLQSSRPQLEQYSKRSSRRMRRATRPRRYAAASQSKFSPR